MNKDDYIIEDTFNPQSRFEHLEHIEPEFWKKKKLEEMSARRMGACAAFDYKPQKGEKNRQTL